MDSDSMFDILKAYGITNQEEFNSEAFSRNIGLLTKAEQIKLSQAKVAIPGMGGVGGIHLITLVRTGICKFHIADFDIYEPANINRQFGAMIPEFGKPKLDVMKKLALSINPYIEFSLFKDGINESNIDDFLDGVDIVIDGLDFFKFDIRRLLFKKAAEKGIYVITAGPMGFSSAMLVFSPDGMGFDDYFNISEGMVDKDKYLSFALGLSPRPTHIKYMDLKKVNLGSKTGPSLNIACQLCSGMASTESVKILLKKGKIKPVPYYVQYDPYLQKLRKGSLFMGNKNPLQRIKMFAIKNILEKNNKTLTPQIDIPPIPKNFDNGIPMDILTYIVTMGTWAPSADNIQLWKFAWDGRTLSLLKDSEKTGFFYDVNKESTHLTFGALIENISISASHFGLKVEIDLFPKDAAAECIANLKFFAESIEEDPLFENVLSRCVNREFYTKKQIAQNIISDLKEMFSQSSDAELIWVDNEKEKKILQKVVFDADRILFEEKRLHQGLFRWINMENGVKKDGMDLDVLGLNYMQQLIFPLMAEWKKMKLMNKIGASRLAAFNSVRLLKSSSAYGLIAIKNRKPETYVAGGRIMERFWIKANSLGLSLQPMAGFVFLLNHLAADGGQKFRSDHQKLIQNFQYSISQIKSLNRDFNYIMFFRMGISDKSTKRTQRKTPVLSK